MAAQTERVLLMIDGKIESEVHLSRYDGSELEMRIEKDRGEMPKVGI